MILKLRIDSQDLRPFIPETYPAAEPDALDDIVSVGVVVPLVAVQTGSSADQRRTFNVRRHREEEDIDVASSRAASNTPQKRDSRPSPEQVNTKMVGVPEALLSQFQCAQEPGPREPKTS